VLAPPDFGFVSGGQLAIIRSLDSLPNTRRLMRFLSLRAIFLLGFVVAMPLLALPPVARRIDELLYGRAPADFGKPPAGALLTDEALQAPAEAMTPPAAAHRSDGRTARADFARASGSPQFDEVSPASRALPATATEAPVVPTLASAPQFGSPPLAGATAPERAIDERTIARLQQIRGSLEQLGADYVIVDTQESGRYRFHCRMLVDASSRFTKPFEAASFDPVAAGEQVLRDVQSWRAAATEARTAAR
jgi:hypothetical protein